ncbi:hypothetical protein [Tateyamaria sp.]|uniref:hypothetical protein n=1 Tax=Tateyamaria sp. TaxID=1929288 RepID=UPI00329BAFA1
MDIEYQLHDPIYVEILALIYASGGDPDKVEKEMDALHTKIVNNEFSDARPQGET